MSGDSLSAVRRHAPPQWGRVTAGIVAGVALALVSLELLWTDGPTVGFLSAVGVVLVLEVALLGVLLGLDLQERPTGLTLATWVTVARAGAVAVLAGFVVAVPPSGTVSWVPGALFAVAAGLDALDGALARTTDTVTELGARLDVEVDGLVVLVGTLVAVGDGGVPAAFLAVAGARYLFVAGQWWRVRRGRPIHELPPSRVRRTLGALAMVAIWLGLMPVPGPVLSHAFATVVLVPFLANFCWDWLAVTGRVGGPGSE